MVYTCPRIPLLVVGSWHDMPDVGGGRVCLSSGSPIPVSDVNDGYGHGSLTSDMSQSLRILPQGGWDCSGCLALSQNALLPITDVDRNVVRSDDLSNTPRCVSGWTYTSH